MTIGKAGSQHNPTKGSKKGYNGRQRETRLSGRRTHHPKKGNKKGYNGRQDPQEGGHDPAETLTLFVVCIVSKLCTPDRRGMCRVAIALR